MPTQSTSTSQRLDLSRANQQLMTGFTQKDAAGIAALYTEAGQLLPAYSVAITGRAAIQAFWQGCLDMGICALHRQPIEVDQLHETVNELGTYELYGYKDKLLDVGKYIVIWKSVQDRWQIYRDIWTSNLSPKQPKDATGAQGIDSIAPSRPLFQEG